MASGASNSEGVSRRALLSAAAGATGAAAAWDAGLGAVGRPVSAQEARLTPDQVRFRPEIEPLVRLIEETPRDRLMEEIGARIRGGTSYQQILSGLMLAGVRNIQPRPVGFKFHAVMVVFSAHQASLNSPDSDRWLPILWALDQFKSSQADQLKAGKWTLSSLSGRELPSAEKAREQFTRGMDRWDEAMADAAVARLAQTAGPTELFELFFRYGARDFRDIGHKAIYVANAYRTLQVIGWEHSEPIVRSLAYALLQRGNVNPADADEPADRPWRKNLERVRQLRSPRLAGRTDPNATRELLVTLRDGSPDDASEAVIRLLNAGVDAGSLWDGVVAGAGELIMRNPGLIGIHCVTTANALRYAGRTSGNDETRAMTLLQAAAFMPMFRSAMGNVPPGALDRLEPLPVAAGGAGVEEIFESIRPDRTHAARKTLGYLEAGGSATELMTAARRLIFRKGTNSHDYKFSSASLEDTLLLAPEWRARFLATAMFNLKGARDADNPLATRALSALKG